MKLGGKGKFGIKANKNPVRFTEKFLYPNEFECLSLKRTGHLLRAVGK